MLLPCWTEFKNLYKYIIYAKNSLKAIYSTGLNSTSETSGADMCMDGEIFWLKAWKLAEEYGNFMCGYGAIAKYYGLQININYFTV